MVLHQPARMIKVILHVKDVAVREHVGVDALANFARQVEEARVWLEGDVDGGEVVAAEGERARLVRVELSVRALFGGEFGVMASEAAVGVEEGQPDGGEGADAADYAVGYAFGAAGHSCERLWRRLGGIWGVRRAEHEICMARLVVRCCFGAGEWRLWRGMRMAYAKQYETLEHRLKSLCNLMITNHIAIDCTPK